jgi:hypothetical protein
MTTVPHTPRDPEDAIAEAVWGYVGGTVMSAEELAKAWKLAVAKKNRSRGRERNVFDPPVPKRGKSHEHWSAKR